MPTVLERALQAHLAGQAAITSQDPLNAVPDAVLGRALCDTLIDYCSFHLAPENTVDPFDDPFVGAAILTSRGKLLGAHRKEGRNEPHAEAVAMVLALDAIDSDEGRELRGRISDAYRRKLWLRSETDRDRFIELFRLAGQLVRADAGEPLILLSTLEPCRDFETQPGCAYLITAFHPDVVLYASDDTNEKGQGRPVMEQGKLTVLPNLSPAKNIAANLLFYASVHFTLQLNREAAKAHDSFEVFYSSCRLDTLSPDPDVRSGRLEIKFAESVNIYRAPGELRASMPQLVPFHPNCVDKRRVLFLNYLSGRFLADYLHRHFENAGCVPGCIVCSRTTEADLTAVRAALAASGIRIYWNVFRKSDEHFAALQSIRRWRESRIGGSYLHLVIKRKSEYEAASGQASDLVAVFARPDSTRKATIYLPYDCLYDFYTLMRSLRSSRTFEEGGSLERVSVLAVVVFPSDKSLAFIKDELGTMRHWLLEQGFGARVRVRHAWEDAREPEVLQRLITSVASGVLDPLSLEPGRISKLLDSEDWKGRQAAGWLLSASARRNPDLFDEIITRRLPSAFSPDEWRRSCSVLNAIGKAGRPAKPGRLLTRMEELALSIEDTLRRGDTVSCLDDVVWRFAYSVCAIAETREEIVSLLGTPGLQRRLGTSSFLMKELCSYASRSERAIRTALPFALDLVRTFGPALSKTDNGGVQRRLARLASIADVAGFHSAAASVRECALVLDGAPAALNEESNLCSVALTGGLPAVFGHENAPKALCSYLFLQTSSQRGSFRGIAAAVASELAAVIAGPISGPESIVSWRGDKTPLARLVLSEVSDADLVRYLAAMATDEDETIQWAALVLAFAQDVRLRLGAKSGSKEANYRSRVAVASIIDTILDEQPHYWLVREFFTHLCAEHANTQMPIGAQLQASDFGPAKQLLRSRETASLHPEVASAVKRWEERFRRVALVLPPLARSAQQVTPESSTPALGIASLATFLESRGHLVDLFDLHRFPALSHEFPESVRCYDFVGFNVVTSTFSATREIAAEIKTVLRQDAPRVVLGGHAVTLQPKDFILHRSFQWDYLVLGDGELPLAHLVESNGSPAAGPHQGLIERSQPLAPAYNPHRWASDGWSASPWINRRLFLTPNGQLYEPTKTRNQAFREAHIVMSRGCAWKCNFCTESILRGSSGEARRAPDDVVAEISALVTTDGVNRIQFVDDNLLPQIAAPGADQRFCRTWTSEFLAGLTKIKNSNPMFGWRGIFRFEDFISYAQQDGWYDVLVKSGCSLLAFGVEHGSEVTRKKLKGGSVSNEEIRGVVSHLRAHAIATKGYFIIGGPRESPGTSQLTIDLAIDAGFTLAYFALYKHFRRLVELSATNKNGAELRERRFLTFRMLQADFDERLKSIKTDAQCIDSFGEVIPRHRLEEALAVASRLREKGFNFADLFKYNDFHDFQDGETELAVWASGSRGSEDFLRCVRKAYLLFYARREFIDNYEVLLTSGY